MIRKTVSIMVVLFFVASAAMAGMKFERYKVELPDTVQAGFDTLKLNGAGIRTKVIFKLYIGGLYLKTPNKNAEAIINADESMAVKIVVIDSLITTDALKDALDEGLKTATNNNIAPIQRQRDAFLGFFTGKIEVGDIIELIYIQDNRSVFVQKNGNIIGSVDNAFEFKKALFGIYLGKKPADNGLKRDMLAGVKAEDKAAEDETTEEEAKPAPKKKPAKPLFDF